MQSNPLPGHNRRPRNAIERAQQALHDAEAQVHAAALAAGDALLEDVLSDVETDLVEQQSHIRQAVDAVKDAAEESGDADAERRAWAPARAG